MSNNHSNKSNFTQSRRNFLKNAAVTSALSVGGLSSLAFAANGNNNNIKTTDSVDSNTFANNGISVMQQQMLHKESVSLFNNSDEPITLDELSPITIERINGSLIVKPNLAEEEAIGGVFMMQARQRISFDIQTTGSIFSSAEIRDTSKREGQLLHISSEHSAFNKLIPVSNADSDIA